MTKERIDIIESRLKDKFTVRSLSITDDSHLHAGHPGAQGGAGHYTVELIADEFKDLSRVARHQLVYEQFTDLIPHEIHALRIKADAPEK